jgi:hypothetical protein
MVKFIIILAASIGAFFLCKINGVKVSYADFKDYCNALLAISGMVFTIMGIWIAFLYPNALLRLMDTKKVETADFSEAYRDTRRLESIVASIIISASVAVAISILMLIKMIFSGTPVYLENLNSIKSAAVAIIIFLSFYQYYSVLRVIYANYMFVSDLHIKREDAEADKDI